MWKNRSFFGTFKPSQKPPRDENDDILVEDDKDVGKSEGSYEADSNSAFGFNSTGRFDSGNKDDKPKGFDVLFSLNSGENDRLKNVGSNGSLGFESKSPPQSKEGVNTENRSKDSLFEAQARRKRRLSNRITDQPPVENAQVRSTVNISSSVFANDPSFYVPGISDPVQKRLTIDLPVSQLNSSALKTQISIQKNQKGLQDLEKSVEKTEARLLEVKSQIQDIVTKSDVLTKNAELISKKMSIVNEWFDTIDNSKTSAIVEGIEWFVWFFSFLTAILMFIWKSIKRPIKKAKQL